MEKTCTSVCFPPFSRMKNLKKLITIYWIILVLYTSSVVFGLTCRLSVTVTGAASEKNKICRYSSGSNISIEAFFNSDCLFTNDTYQWSIFWLDPPSNKVPMNETKLQLPNIEHFKPCLNIGTSDALKKVNGSKGVFEVKLKFSGILERTNITVDFLTFFLVHGCSNVYYQDCCWIREQMALLQIAISLQESKKCSEVSTKLVNTYSLNPVKLLTTQKRNIYSPGDSGMQWQCLDFNCSCNVTPKVGYSLFSQFNITCDAYGIGMNDSVKYMVYSKVQYNNKQSLLFTGSSSNFLNVYLSEGLEKNNYTYVLYVTVSKSGTRRDAYCGDMPVQIYPASMGKQGDVSKVISDLIGSNIESNDSVIDDLISHGDYSNAVSILGTVASTLNGKALSSSDSSSKEKSKKVREVIIHDLQKVKVTSLDDLNQVTGVLNLATSVSDEVSEYSENVALDVYSNLTGVLSKSIDTEDSTKGEDSVGLLLDGLSFMLDVNTDVGTKETSIDTTVQNTKVKTSGTKILNLVDSLADAAITLVEPAAEPVVFVTSYMNLVVAKSSVEKTLGQTLSNSRSQNNTGQVHLPNDTMFSHMIKDMGNISLQMMLIDKNPYVWDQSSESVTTSVVSMTIKAENKTEIVVDNLKEPVHILMNNNAKMNSTIYTVQIPLVLENDVYVVKDENSTMTKLTVQLKKGYSFITTIRCVIPELYFKVLCCTEGNKTGLSKANAKLLNKDNNFTYISEPASEDNSYDMYLTLVLDNSTDLALTNYILANNYSPDCSRVQCQEKITIGVNITIETYSVACLYWKKEKEVWTSDGCQVSSQTSRYIIDCECTHLTSFSGSFFVLPNLVDPFADAALFLTFFENPVVICAVLIVWFLYLSAILWARRADQKDEAQTGIVILSDAKSADPYQYLMCVVTGWWRGAETTAKVSCFINGSKGQSTQHCLSDSVVGKACFQAGWEDWFLFTSPKHLGDLKSVTIWHDNSGLSPSWYLTRVLIQDLTTNDVYSFIYGDWIGIERGMTKVTIPNIEPEDFNQYKNKDFVLKTSRDLREGHLWLSIISKPCNSNFTRVQRLTCCLSILLCMMLTSIMFHGIPTDDAADQVQVSSFTFSLTDLVIGIECAIIMFPINMVIVQLFMRTAVKPIKKKSDQIKINYVVDIGIPKDVLEEKEQLLKRRKKTAAPPKMLPWWFIYITWFIVMTVSLLCSYFVMLYGLKYGYQKSMEWLVSFLTAFFQSSCFQQPIKVLVVALILTYIFRKPVEIEGISTDINFEDKVMFEDEVTEPQFSVPRPVSKSILQQMKDKLYMEGLIDERLREIILYLLFTAIVLFVIHGQRNVRTSYYCTNTMEDIFVRKSFRKDRLTLMEITSVPKFWDYLRIKGFPGLKEFYTDDRSVVTHGSDFYLVGPFRLRHLRIKTDTCPTSSSIIDAFSITVGCYDSYWIGDEDTSHYNGSWNSRQSSAPSSPDHWTYQTAWELGTIPYTGTQATYSGGGYVWEITPDKTTEEIIADLQAERWIDERTRAIFIEFTLYNPNVNLFTAVMFLFEFSSNGAILPFYQIFPTKLYHYGNGTEITAAVCEVLFVIFIIVFTYYDFKKLRTMGCKTYLSEFWNVVELGVIFLSYSLIGLFFQRLVTIKWIMEKYVRSNRNKFVSFYSAISWDFILMYVMGFLVFLLIVKFLKILSFNKNMYLLSNTLHHARKALSNYMVLICVLMIAFAHFTLLVFGPVLKEYRGFGHCFLSLFNFALGASDFYGLKLTDSFLGPLFYFVFTFMVLFIYLTVFVAILNKAIAETKLDLLKKKNELEVMSYLITKLSHILPYELAVKLRNKKYRA